MHLVPHRVSRHCLALDPESVAYDVTSGPGSGFDLDDLPRPNGLVDGEDDLMDMGRVIEVVMWPPVLADALHKMFELAEVGMIGHVAGVGQIRGNGRPLLLV